VKISHKKHLFDNDTTINRIFGFISALQVVIIFPQDKVWFEHLALEPEEQDYLFKEVVGNSLCTSQY
jgi:hypothetical protein